ncbi:MAG: hypothetical protein E7K72_00885 [Roseomonas mucosa]|nr:hypothetical protein [Roseomonas mucosa]
MFHDCSVVRFDIRGRDLLLETEEFSLSETETLPAARILIAGSRCIHRDGELVAAFEVESDDAEIYSLDSLPDGVRMHLLWHFWRPRAPERWRSYWFPGATLVLQALAGGPLLPFEVRSNEA